jgi:hypothetical protein
MSKEIQFTAKLNGKGDLHGVISLLENGELLYEDLVNLSKAPERTKLTNLLQDKYQVEDAERQILQVMQTNRRERESSGNTSQDVAVLDEAPSIMSRPLDLIDGHAYVATWPWAQITTIEGTTQDLVRFIVRDDGAVFGPNDLASLGLQITLDDIPPVSKLWRSKAMKAYRDGQRPDCLGVFNRLTSVYDRFIDFRRSFAEQSEMCELSACFSLATWFSPAFTVLGYPWPNGEGGSGKTQWGVCWANTSYLGMVVLASGSFAALRDLADYGAALLFDDAENLGDVKRTDPDKRALFLAGNRRGAQVPIKEPSPDGRGWRTRWINAFCPRGFTAISLPDPVLGSRSIRIPLVRTADPRKGNADPEDLNRWPCDQQQLQDDLWSMALSLMAEAAEIWGELQDEVTMTGREFEPWRALIAVARLFERHGVEGLEGRLRQTMENYQKEKDDIDTSNRATQTLRAILWQQLDGLDVSDVLDITDVCKVRSNKIIVTASKVSETIKVLGEEMGWDVEWATAKAVGWRLRSLRFEAGRDSSKNRNRSRTMEGEAFVELCQGYGLVKLGVSENYFSDPTYQTSNLSETSQTSEKGYSPWPFEENL